MSGASLIGVDVGTQAVKVGVFSAEGRCLAEASEPSMLKRDRGAVEEDPEYQVRSAAKAIKTCVEKAGLRAPDVACLAFDGQMAGILGIGLDGRSVTPYDSWLDTRCAPYVEKMRHAAGDAILRSAGGAPSFNHGPKILWWKHEHPRVYERVRAFVQPAAYVALRLTGGDAGTAFIDETYLHFSGFADIGARVWNDDLCRLFDVERPKLPPIVAPTEIVGKLSDEGAAACGLLAGTPVAAGCGDTAASFLSCGATAPGVCVDVSGTASVFAATTDRHVPDVETQTVACGRSATPGLWHPYAYVNGGGLNLEWFRGVVSGLLPGSAKTVSFAALDAAAARVGPSAGDPVFVPHFGGRVMPPDAGLRGGWVGLTWEHGAGHLYRAILESVACEYALYARCIASIYGPSSLRELRVTGGGATNALWNEMKADVCGLPVAPVAASPGAPAGAAILAGVAAGVLDGVAKAANAWVKTARTIQPDSSRRAHYDARIRIYREIIDALPRSIG